MGGNLDALVSRLCIEGKDSTWKNYIGFGLFPEATETNPIVYELAAEMAWHSRKPDVGEWLQDYATARYGMNDPKMQEAWKVLYATVYGKKRGVTLVGESPDLCPSSFKNQRSVAQFRADFAGGLQFS